MGGGGNRWIRPEAYPILAVMAVALGMNLFCITRNLLGHPDVSITKENRASGFPENFKEGKNYKYHSLRAYLKGKDPEVMPKINAALRGYKR